MDQDKLITLQLPALYVGQILDGLDVLIEQWDATERYHASGKIDEEACIRECTDAHEAANIARFYREIQTAVEEQYGSQLKS